jgi:hypothetical protein
MKKQNLFLVLFLTILLSAIAQTQFRVQIVSALSTPSNTNPNSPASTPLTPEQMQMIQALQAAFDADKPEILREMMAVANDPNRSPPQVSILSLAQNQSFCLGDNITLCFTVNQPSNYSYSINNQGKISIAGNITLTGLPSGNQSLIIYAQNAAGKVGNSQPVNFTVTQPVQLEAKKLPNATPVTLIDTVAGVFLATALGLTVATYCWRRKK